MKRGPGGRRRNSACSSRLSSISTDNAYLKEWSSPITLTLKPLSSDKDIIQFLAFLLHDRLRYPINDDDNLFTELKCITLTLKSPLHLTNSELKNPGTPHSFPRVLAVLHWLVQLAMHNDHLLLLSSDDHAHDILSCHKKSYGHYLNGQDDAIERTYEPFNEILKQEKNLLLENVNVLLAEANLEVMKSAPSLKESRENVKKESEKDIDKFNALIDRLQQMDAKMQMELEDKEKELRLKADERNKICEENEELKKKVEEQAINMRDAERMKRELQSVERDIADAEIERSKWEDKCWDLDAVIGTKFKELEALQTECNQAIRTYLTFCV
ncbi:kinetochore protein NDC80 homolog [Bidens hawaiensis]|uniref:kinetochore protein NDC80 homolog n=1 Tax=Bidens hawaiensis TaxID=980011 RepID=UPI00404A8C84